GGGVNTGGVESQDVGESGGDGSSLSVVSTSCTSLSSADMNRLAGSSLDVEPVELPYAADHACSVCWRIWLMEGSLPESSGGCTDSSTVVSPESFPDAGG